VAKFLNNIHSEDIGYYQGRLVRRLLEPLIWVHEDKRKEIPIGFASDGASVPRVPLVYDAWGDRAHREAFGHDYDYRKNSILLIVDPRVNEFCTGFIPERYIIRRESIPKEDADWYFRITMRDRPQPYQIYQPMYLAVRMCGGPSFHRMNVMDSFPVEAP